jgi:hypothetical protein
VPSVGAVGIGAPQFGWRASVTLTPPATTGQTSILETFMTKAEQRIYLMVSDNSSWHAGDGIDCYHTIQMTAE